MDLKVNAVNFTADRKLVDFIEEKVKKLEALNAEIIKSEVFLKVEKTESKENKIAEIRLHIPGNDLFAKKQCKTFEEATDQVVDALKKQVKKTKARVV